MANLVLTKTRLRAGVWEGVLTGHCAVEPVLTLRHNSDIVPGLTLEKREDEDGGDQGWHVRAPIPADRIADGIQTFVITDESGETVLAQFAVFAGEHSDDDLRAEVDLLRAELDLLKRAFRRHCDETS